MTGMYLAGGFAVVMTALHFLSIALAWKRCKAPLLPARLSVNPPAVTLVRPLCGINAYETETLRSSFQLDYPDYEVIFCVADPDDRVVALANALMAAYPNVPSRLITGAAAISHNPKLNNCVRGWEAARHGWIILADSNVLMPADYIQRLLARWQPGCGLVCSTPVGSRLFLRLRLQYQLQKKK